VWIIGALLLVTAVMAALALALRPDHTSPRTASADPPPRRSKTQDVQPTPSPQPSTDREHDNAKPSGPVLPARIIGGDSKPIEEMLKSRGYDVTTVDIESTAAEESVVDTLPPPNRTLTPGQPIVLIVSKGEPPEENASYRVPPNLIGADVHDVEGRLKAQSIHVTKISVDAPQDKDTVLVTYPRPGTYTEGAELILVVSSGHPPD
jgi:hypothetical protein